MTPGREPHRLLPVDFTLSAETCSRVPLTQAGFSGLLLNTGSDLWRTEVNSLDDCWFCCSSCCSSKGETVLDVTQCFYLMNCSYNSTQKHHAEKNPVLGAFREVQVVREKIIRGVYPLRCSQLLSVEGAIKPWSTNEDITLQSITENQSNLLQTLNCFFTGFNKKIEKL